MAERHLIGIVKERKTAVAAVMLDWVPVANISRGAQSSFYTVPDARVFQKLSFNVSTFNIWRFLTP